MVVSFTCPYNQGHRRDSLTFRRNTTVTALVLNAIIAPSSTQVRDRCTDLVWQESLYSFLERIQN
ncbi:hypothetical protein T11_13505 [Trichinella zimbabwensis]|uniref:Uncharacterized protein n=1 Tax=Trichinella zimbabwensis TaxID=268475 RepID=A0A0V1GBA3_9BILA|nr:hypothetical protein T11_13505 [Trichinella zimbabwensis]